MIAQLNFGRKVRCHNEAVEMFGAYPILRPVGVGMPGFNNGERPVCPRFITLKVAQELLPSDTLRTYALVECRRELKPGGTLSVDDKPNLVLNWVPGRGE